ncbi:ABC transporter substrate-binding protein [Shinella daejeonensis]|uniref:ABC transporter substrate-binding protein n=1 Tax=Shinella daejeonensis TaxID=659017 RepID=UPI0020C78155|nr:ABC transporter substrate-binding protein [Shinella daejeonensis]MCP8895141.1 ABC transporter substrate-binding protein [Shinella daejeonensis]
MIGRRWYVAILAGLFLWPATARPADVTPRRVVSMNVCTDQLAMLVARPGQLHSVSYLASDPESSAMVREAAAYVPNHALAEEIFLMKPDLILTGAYTTRTTVSLLRRLGFRVEEFQPETSFNDVRANIRRMGDVLANPQRASELVAAMDGEIAALKGQKPLPLRTALYFANSYTSGAGTLVSEVVDLAGLVNIADGLGLAGTARLPLELLILSRPELLAGVRPRQEKPALAGQNFDHPAYRALLSKVAAAPLEDRLTVCGGPFTVEAARVLQNRALQDRTHPADGTTLQ